MGSSHRSQRSRNLAITIAHILNDGSILASGQSQTVANDPQVRRYYLGEAFQL